MLNKKQKFISCFFFITMFINAMLKDMLVVFMMFLVALAALFLPCWIYVDRKEKERNKLATKKRNRSFWW